MNDPEKIAARTKEYEERFLSPFVAAERGYIDEVIMPHSHPPAGGDGPRHAGRKACRAALEEARQPAALRLKPSDFASVSGTQDGNVQPSAKRTVRR